VVASPNTGVSPLRCASVEMTEVAGDPFEMTDDGVDVGVLYSEGCDVAERVGCFRLAKRSSCWPERKRSCIQRKR